MENLMLTKLRELMQDEYVDAYIVMTDDYHQSEYVGEFFKARAALTGFTGSQGIALVTQNKAIMWTDGRYFLQAAKEMANTGFELYKSGVKGVDTLEEYIEKNLTVGMKLGFDGRTMPSERGKKLNNICEKIGIELDCDLDYISEIWENRPNLPTDPIFALDYTISGKETSDKLIQVREKMTELKTKHHVLSCLDDICWLLNIRGNDIPYCPFVLSYVVINEDNVILFIDKNKVPVEIEAILEKANVEIKNYDDFYDYIESADFEGDILVDLKKINYSIYSSLKINLSVIREGFNVIEVQNPTILLKAMKNKIELENSRDVHIRDSVAITKFMIWIKENADSIPMDEISVSNKLLEFREQDELFFDQSFGPISAYGPNAAYPHYHATEGNCSDINPQGFYLIDSGGHYFGGSTDVTRTFALGDLSETEIKHYTMVLKSVINLSKIKFMYGCTGQNLDILSRSVMWNECIDYNHGTGHGLGYMLNVHEAPNGFRWQSVPERNDSSKFEEGMITTIEPGIYIEGSHGIRIEQNVVSKLHCENEYGKFMEFEMLTFVPMDLDAVDANMLNKEERDYLNNYHKDVYEILSPFMSDDENEVLKRYTRSI